MTQHAHTTNPETPEKMNDVLLALRQEGYTEEEMQSLFRIAETLKKNAAEIVPRKDLLTAILHHIDTAQPVTKSDQSRFLFIEKGRSFVQSIFTFNHTERMHTYFKVLVPIGAAAFIVVVGAFLLSSPKSPLQNNIPFMAQNETISKEEALSSKSIDADLDALLAFDTNTEEDVSLELALAEIDIALDLLLQNNAETALGENTATTGKPANTQKNLDANAIDAEYQDIENANDFDSFMEESNNLEEVDQTLNAMS